jgi:hypothetical protein
MTIGLTWRRTDRRIKRLKETLFTISPDFSDRSTPDFLALSDVRVLDIQDGIEGDHAPVCLGGRGAAPPEFCGGPTGYRLMLERQREGAARRVEEAEGVCARTAGACSKLPIRHVRPTFANH